MDHVAGGQLMIQLLVVGLAAGSAYAVLGWCLVLLFRSTGVLNLSQAAFGAFGVYVAALAYDHGLTAWSSAVVGLVAGIALSVLVGSLVTSLFQERSEAVRITAMIAVTVGLMTLGLRVFGDLPRSVAPIIPIGSVSVGGISLATDVIALLLLGVVLLLVSTYVLQRTRAGAVLRGVATRPATAELLGVPVRAISVTLWAVTGALATISMLLFAPARSLDFRTLVLLVLPAMAAALVGAFNSLVATFLGGLGLGMVESLSVTWPSISEYKGVLPFLVVVLAVVWSQRKEQWDEAR